MLVTVGDALHILRS